jgi:hypothetical protein
MRIRIFMGCLLVAAMSVGQQLITNPGFLFQQMVARGDGGTPSTGDMIYVVDSTGLMRRIPRSTDGLCLVMGASITQVPGWATCGGGGGAVTSVAGDGTHISCTPTTGAVVCSWIGGSLAQTITSVAHEWLNSYDATTGLFTQTRPACADLSDSAAGCSAAALPPNGSAAGDLSGTYPNPGVAKVNGNTPGVSGVAHEFVASIDSSARGTLAQPACGDLSDSAAGCSATALPPNGSAGGQLSGTYPNPGLADPLTADVNIGTNTLAASCVNDTSTGTKAKQFAAITSAGKCVVLGAAATDAIGVCESGCGKTGSSKIVLYGQTTVTMDGATTIGHYVGISSSVAGDGHDIGSSVPTGASFGQALTSTGGAGDATVFISPIRGAAGAGTGTVTSAAITGPSALLTWSGSPITTSGTFTAALASFGAHAFLGNSTGGSAAPTATALGSGDVPCAAMPALTGGATSSAGSCATTLAGVPAAAGEPGGCAIFNPPGLAASGPTSYFTAANSSHLQPTGTVTFSFWINPQATPTNPGGIIYKGPMGSVHGDYEIAVVNNTYSTSVPIYLDFNAGTSPGHVCDVPIEVWSHVVLVVHAGTPMHYDAYVNGYAQATNVSAVVNSISTSTNTFYIGQYYATTSGFTYNGRLQDIRIWDGVAATSTNVLALYKGGIGTSTSLSIGGQAEDAWWKLNDAYGSATEPATWADSSGNSLTLSTAGTTAPKGCRGVVTQ